MFPGGRERGETTASPERVGHEEEIEQTMKPLVAVPEPGKPCSFPRLLIWLSLTIGLCSACGIGLPHLVTYQRDAESVDLRDLPIGYPELPKYDHPATIPPNVLLQLLRGVLYRQTGALPLTWQPPRSAFTERQQDLLATQLAKAFGQVLPEEVVAFSVHDEKDSDIYTAGFCFVARHELHLIIEHVREFTYIGEQKTYQQEVRWELVPGSGQRLFTKDSSGKGGSPHWIVLSLEQQ